MPTTTQNITAVILAGGKGSRLGGSDKGLVKLHGQPLVQHVIKRIQPQVDSVDSIFISANRNIDHYERLGFPVFKDDIDDYAGPLAGILKALQQCKTDWLLTVPADSPFIPLDLVVRLSEKTADAKVVIPDDGKHLHPTFALIHVSLAESLKSYLLQGERKARHWMQQQPHNIVDFSDQADAFMNINTEEELEKAEKHFQTFMP